MGNTVPPQHAVSRRLWCSCHRSPTCGAPPLPPPRPVLTRRSLSCLTSGGPLSPAPPPPTDPVRETRPAGWFCDNPPTSGGVITGPSGAGRDTSSDVDDLHLSPESSPQFESAPPRPSFHLLLRERQLLHHLTLPASYPSQREPIIPLPFLGICLRLLSPSSRLTFTSQTVGTDTPSLATELLWSRREREHRHSSVASGRPSAISPHTPVISRQSSVASHQSPVISRQSSVTVRPISVTSHRPVLGDTLTL